MRLRMIVGAMVCAPVLLAPLGAVQQGGRIRIQVESIQLKGGGIQLRDALIDRLKNEKSILVVATGAEADWVLGGFGETYVKGYLGRNHRVRYRNSESRPIFGGYLSVELKDKNDDTVWSNLVTPSRFGARDIGKDLAWQIATRLTEFLAGNSKGAAKP